MFIVRQISENDLDSVLDLAQQLNSFNLSMERATLATQILDSVLSFDSTSRSAARPKDKSIYIFVLEDIYQKKILGTSLVFAKHGTPESPHTYLKVLSKTHEDPELGIKKTHQLLRFEFDMDGPTEIGGLILHPDYRGLPISLGKFLSYARFMYIGMHPHRFEKNILAELLPPFNEEGTSELWEALGRRFTDLDYQEADRLSRTDREFIKNLFPQDDIYTSLFCEKARLVIGEAGNSSRPVKFLLEKIGFSYLHAVDPFDGGPHYGAKTQQLNLIQRMKKVKAAVHNLESTGNLALIGFEGKRGFVCLYVHHRLDGDEVELTQEATQLILREEGDLFNLQLIAPV